ncbi:MAG: DUF1624 domain-containing protein [Oscillospiraceae bacterium]|jgi:uncharacterized membrane protein|nr:DUF1624 domain-containing protein [Oscillospiraceae bacterium]
MQRENAAIALAHSRYFALDALRGLAVVAMVLYHACFTFGEIYGGAVWTKAYAALAPVQPWIAVTFILICGICASLARSNWRRGLRLLIAAVLVSVVTWGLDQRIPGTFISFGILHFLAVSMLLFAPLRGLLRKIPALPQLLMFLAAFLVLLLVFDNGSLPLPQTDHFALYILGFPSATLRSADYFALLPWIFLFFAGTGIGIYGARGRFPAFLRRDVCKPMQWIGRHAFWIYLAHQPVLVFLGYFLFGTV